MSFSHKRILANLRDRLEVTPEAASQAPADEPAEILAPEEASAASFEDITPVSPPQDDAPSDEPRPVVRDQTELLPVASPEEITAQVDGPPSEPSELPLASSGETQPEDPVPPMILESSEQEDSQSRSIPEAVIAEAPQTVVDDALAEPTVPPNKKETAKQRRKREAEEQRQVEERDRLEQEKFDQYRIDQERLEMARLEQKRLERERLRQERREKERLEEERLAQEKLEQETLEQAKLEQERLEQERLDQEKAEQEKVAREKAEQERLEQERLLQARLEQQRLDAQRREEASIEQERLDKQKAADMILEQATAAADTARKKVLEAEAIQVAEQESRSAGEPVVFSRQPQSPVHAARSPPEQPSVPEAATADPAPLSTPPPDLNTKAPVTMIAPVNRLPTPAASVARSSSPRSVTTEASKTKVPASESSSRAVGAPRSEDVDHLSHSRRTTGSPAMPAPKPQAVSQLIEESRPPAPSPPVGKARPRHVPAFDSEDESDSALVRPRRYRGGEDFSRDGSSGSTYPPQPTHHRSVFASRVPAESSYPEPPPPQPPGYHPGYYPPAAPPNYQHHNYRVSQQGYPPPNSYGPPPHSSSSPYEPWNYPPGYRHDSPSQRHDALVNRDYSLGLGPVGDDPGDVFSRIAQAIPDLHVLLARYKETHGQLSVREELLRRSSIEQEEKLRGKDNEIAELNERARNLEHKYSTEASRLRLQIGNLEEQARELQEQRLRADKFERDAIRLDAEMKSLESKYRELQVEHEALARLSAEEKAKAEQDFEEWKSTTTTRNDAEKIALAIQFDKRLKEAAVVAETRRQEVAAAHIKEKDDLRAEHQKEQLERQASYDRLCEKFETAQKDWLEEREDRIKAQQDERESHRRALDEQRDLLESQYRKSKDESDRAWIELHADASRKADEEKARADQMIKEKEELLKKYNALRAESEKEKGIIKSVATNLEAEKARLEKLMECYGDIAEIKSKGDTY